MSESGAAGGDRNENGKEDGGENGNGASASLSVNISALLPSPVPPTPNPLLRFSRLDSFPSIDAGEVPLTPTPPLGTGDFLGGGWPQASPTDRPDAVAAAVGETGIGASRSVWACGGLGSLRSFEGAGVVCSPHCLLRQCQASTIPAHAKGTSATCSPVCAVSVFPLGHTCSAIEARQGSGALPAVAGAEGRVSDGAPTDNEAARGDGAGADAGAASQKPGAGKAGAPPLQSPFPSLFAPPL